MGKRSSKLSAEKGIPPLTINSREVEGINAGVLTVEGDLHFVTVTETKSKNVDTSVNTFLLDIRKNISLMLKTRYMNMQLPRTKWLQNLVLPMDQYYVQLMLHEVDVHKLTKTSIITLENIFQPSGIDFPHRILIEGAPGYGKTTLALKLAFDWSKNLPYLSEFDLLFVLLLRHCDLSIEELLKEEGALNDVAPSDILNAISLNPDKVLIVLDGYDELAETNKKNFLPLLERKKLPRTTVILTSRTGKFSVLNDPLENNKNQTMEAFPSNDIWNKKITIKGIGESHQEQFLKIYLIPEYDFETILAKFQSVIGTKVRELITCPLFLLLLGMLVLDSDLKCPQNKTELYRAVCNLIIRKWLNRELQIDEVVDICVPESHSEPSVYHDLISQVGQFSYKMLKEDKLTFTEDEILCHCDAKVLNLGFFTKGISIRRNWLTTHYEPLHKSLLEFLAAHYLWKLFLQNKLDTFEKEVVSIHTTALQEFDHSLLLPFLAGLLGHDAIRIFKILEPFDYQYSSCFYALVGILLETTMSDSLVQFLVPFIPQRWMISWFDNDQGFSVSPSHFAVIRQGLVSGRIKIVQWNIKNQTVFPPKLRVDRLALLVGESVTNTSCLTCTDFKCFELLFWFSGNPDGVCADDIATVIATGSKLVKHKAISLDLKNFYGDVSKRVLQVLMKELRHGNYHKLSIAVNNVDCLGAIYDFLEKHSLVILDISFAKLSEKNKSKTISAIQKKLNSIIKIIGVKFEFLQDLVLYNDQKVALSLDLSNLCKSQSKVWRRIWLSNFHLYWENENASFPVEELKLFNVKLTLKAMKAIAHCQCKALTCGVALLVQVAKNIKDTGTQFKNLKELTLVLHGQARVRQAMKFVTRFKSIEVFSIDLTPSSRVQDAIDIIMSLPNLRIFEVWEVERNFSFLQELVHTLNATHFAAEKTILLDTLKLQVRISSTDYELSNYNLFVVLNDIRALLQRKVVKKLMVTYPRSHTLYTNAAVFLTRLFPRDCFLIEHDLDGMDETDTYNSRTCYDYNVIFDRYTIIERMVTEN